MASKLAVQRKRLAYEAWRAQKAQEAVAAPAAPFPTPATVTRLQRAPAAPLSMSASAEENRRRFPELAAFVDACRAEFGPGCAVQPLGTLRNEEGPAPWEGPGLGGVVEVVED